MKKKWHFSVKKSQFDGHEVKSSDDLKILGVTIDSKLTLNFSEHIREICKKMSCKKMSCMVCKITAVQIHYSSPPTQDEYRNSPSV